jgi:hypothetical protein
MGGIGLSMEVALLQSIVLAPIAAWSCRMDFRRHQTASNGIAVLGATIALTGLYLQLSFNQYSRESLKKKR